MVTVAGVLAEAGEAEGGPAEAPVDDEDDDAAAAAVLAAAGALAVATAAAGRGDSHMAHRVVPC